MSSITNIRRMNTEPLKSKASSYELMNENVLGPAEAEIEKSLKAMDNIYKDHCNLMADTEAKLIGLNMKSFVLDLSGDGAKGDQDLADLRKALDSKESEIQSLKSKLKDQFRHYQWQMAEKVVEVADLRRDGRAQNTRLINTQRKAKSANRREVARRMALTRSINLLQLADGSLEVKSRTPKPECDNTERKNDDLQDKFESTQSDYNCLKKRFDDSQVAAVEAR